MTEQYRYSHQITDYFAEVQRWNDNTLLALLQNFIDKQGPQVVGQLEGFLREQAERENADADPSPWPSKE